MKMTTHEQFMQRCIQLAQLGSGHVAPNPLVGAVLVHEGRIIGEGYHQKFGMAHAEVNAIEAVQDPYLLSDSTLYVNLEPCSHFGKTPPCSNLILAKKIGKVVIGMEDPNPIVNGKGISQLKSAGVDVITGVLEKECRNLNKRFISIIKNQRPYITLKWAMTADGFAGRRGEKIQISNPFTGIIGHSLRHQEQAIMVGAGTILSDNPQLNTRHYPGKDPIRIVIDPKGKLQGNEEYHIYNGEQRTIIFTGNPNSGYPNCETILLNGCSSLARFICTELVRLQINSVLLEGGPTLQNEFLSTGNWDECYIYQGQNNLQQGLKAPELPCGKKREISIGSNTIIHISPFV